MLWMKIPVLLLFGLLYLPGVRAAYTYEDEENLRYQLFTNYSTDVRPSTPTQITVTMALMSLNYLAISTQEMCANVIVVLSWTDSRLAWTPADHNGIDKLVVKYGTTWLPPTVVENGIDSAGLLGEDAKVPQSITSSGQISWLAPLYARVSCSMKVAYFPFDTQTCHIKLYGWTYSISEMELKNSAVGWDNPDYKENGEWSLRGMSVDTHFEASGTETFKSLLFGVTFKRKFTFLFLTLIIPAILNSLLMCAVFYLPFGGDTDKLGYSLTVLLSYYVLLTLVSDILPPISTDISILQTYLTCVMCTGTLSTLSSVSTVAIYAKSTDEDPIPPWVAYLYHNVLSILVCRKGSLQKLPTACCPTCCGRRSRSKSKVEDGASPPSTPGGSLSPNSPSDSNTGPTLRSMYGPSRYPPRVNINGGGTARHSIGDGGGSGGANAKKQREIRNARGSIIRENAFIARTMIFNEDRMMMNDTNRNSNEQGPHHFSKDSHGCFIADLKSVDGGRTDNDDDKRCDHNLTWQQMAVMMDAVFLRLIGGSMTILTIIVGVLLISNY